MDATLRAKYKNRYQRAEEYTVENTENPSVKYVFLTSMATSTSRNDCFMSLADWKITENSQKRETALSVSRKRKMDPVENAGKRESKKKHDNFISKKTSCVLLGCYRQAAVVDVDSALHTVLTVNNHKFPLPYGVLYSKTHPHLNVVPISCTCPDWLYRGVEFGTNAFTKLSVPYQEQTRGIRHGWGADADRVMGAVRGCKHMIAVELNPL